MPYPAGSIALVEALERVADVSLPLGDLPARAEATRARLDEIIANNPEHQAMLRQLEAEHERTTGADRLDGNLPTGDELAAELERYLRDQRGDG
jgi:hypothetical protein